LPPFTTTAAFIVSRFPRQRPVFRLLPFPQQQRHSLIHLSPTTAAVILSLTPQLRADFLSLLSFTSSSNPPPAATLRRSFCAFYRHCPILRSCLLPSVLEFMESRALVGAWQSW
jgi:hypothetical protein